MTDALTVRSVDGDPWSFEGLMIPYGGPMNGRDLTGTRFTPETDYCLDWNPSGDYPLLMEHGFDGATKTDVVGRWSFRAWDDHGGWARGKLDEAYAYAEDIKALVKEGALRFSSGAVDHLYDFDKKSGAIKLWPLVEGSLVTRPANPDQPAVALRSVAQYAVKSVDAIAHYAKLGIVLNLPEKSLGEIPTAALGVGAQGAAGLDPAVTMSVLVPDDLLEAEAPQKSPQVENISGARLRDLKDKQPFLRPGEGDVDDQETGISDVGTADAGGGDGGGGAGLSLGVPAPKARATKSDSLARVEAAIAARSTYSPAAGTASYGASILGQMIDALGWELDEPEQAAKIQAAIDAWSSWLDDEIAEIGAAPDEMLLAADQSGVFFPAYASLAAKAGARNSAADLSHIQSIHDAASSLGADCYGSGKAVTTPPATVLAVKAGDDAVPVSEADLDDMVDRLADQGVRRIREALGIY